MPWMAIPLPDATVSSGGTRTSPAWNVEDAEFVGFRVTSATSAPGLTAVGALTSSGGTYTTVTYATSTALSVVTASSGSGIIQIRVGALKELALQTSAAAAASITAQATKFVQV